MLDVTKQSTDESAGPTVPEFINTGAGAIEKASANGRASSPVLGPRTSRQPAITEMKIDLIRVDGDTQSRARQQKKDFNRTRTFMNEIIDAQHARSRPSAASRDCTAPPQLPEGAFCLPGYLTMVEQKELVEMCRGFTFRHQTHRRYGFPMKKSKVDLGS